MGNYVFDADALVDALRKDSHDDPSRHDIGGNIIPTWCGTGACRPTTSCSTRSRGDVVRRRDWRDVGSADATSDARHGNLCAVEPIFDLYNDKPPILTYVPSLPPEFVHLTLAHGSVARSTAWSARRGDLWLGLARLSVLSPGVRVNSWATVERVGVAAQHQDGWTSRGPRRDHRQERHRAGVAQVGVDKEHDRARGFVVSSAGITVVGKGQEVVP